MKKLIMLISFVFLFSLVYGGNIENNMRIESFQENLSGLDIQFNLGYFNIENVDIDGENFQNIITSSLYLNTKAGAPDLPFLTRIIAIPQNSTPNIEIISFEKEEFFNIIPIPTIEIPLGNDNSPLKYNKDTEIYNNNVQYPNELISLSEPSTMRGIDIVTFTINPVIWDPVEEKIIVYKNIEFRINFIGGNNKFGDDRLRTRNWDNIFRANILNFNSLPTIDYSQRIVDKLSLGRDNAEFIIIVPNDADFISWADSIKKFRIEEGIITEVFTLNDIGGSSSTQIENFINNAYNTWTIPPEAVLLLSDYPNSGDAYGITSPLYNSYCVSDNIYADVNGNNLPDINFGRITAQNLSQLNTMIMKDISYERTPPNNYNFYDNPLASCGWQTDRWFQLCSEIIRGFWEVSLLKNPTRVYAIYSGTPVVGGNWSTAGNTYTIVNYFSNLGYIPTTVPAGIDWYGTGQDMINAIDNGTFILQHRDHGGVTGWGEPNFGNAQINLLSQLGLELPFVYSTECLTGKYNDNSECFAEKFHRIDGTGALGVNAASETSFSFVNDVFVWGNYDYMWPDFDPGHGTSGPVDLRPAFAMTSAKWYLWASTWCSSYSKVVTYHLFHHHGDPYMRLFSEIPGNISASYPSVIVAGETSFQVIAPSGSFIALTVGDNIIGRAEATGSKQNITIDPQSVGVEVKLTITKQNYFRYKDTLEVVNSSTPHVVYEYINSISGGHNNGQINAGNSYNLNIALANWGLIDAVGVNAYLFSSDPNVSISADTLNYGNISSFDTSLIGSDFSVTLNNSIADSTIIILEMNTIDNNDSLWTSSFEIYVNSPIISLNALDGPLFLAPGDNFYLSPEFLNNGSGTGFSLSSVCRVSDPHINIIDSTCSNSVLLPDSTITIDSAFQLSVSSSCPEPHFVDIEIITQTAGGYYFYDTVSFGIGSTFSDDFENGTSLWNFSGPTTWHITQHNSYSTNSSMYCGEEGSWQYLNMVINSRLEIPTLYLKRGSQLTYWQYYEFADNYDKIQLQYSLDNGSTWELLYPEEGYTGVWGYPPYDSIYTGSHKVWQQQHINFYSDGNIDLSWLFFSNSSGSAEGYYLDDVNIILGSGFVGVEEISELPDINICEFSLNRAYPNPLSNNAVISYSIGSENTYVKLAIFDITGREIKTLVQQNQGIGNYRVQWDGRDNSGTLVSSGSYFYRIEAGSFRDGSKIVVVR